MWWLATAFAQDPPEPAPEPEPPVPIEDQPAIEDQPTPVPEPAPEPAPLAVPVATVTPRPPAVPTTPEPRSGTGAIITGAIFTGVGALSVTDLATCLVLGDGVTASDPDSCLVYDGFNAAVGFGVGVPLLVSGLNRRKVHAAWKQGTVAVAVDREGVALRVGGRL
ncbi:MAG: hypothetical protein H6735_33295 [Alphaproteobacteria bacterium]|nr:hypothetical protein [Alphaproteobacteria bacterium]